MALQLSAATKARVAVAGLALLLAWPFAHYRLVETYRLNPWRFFGFAMYCRPTLPVSVDAQLVQGAEAVAYPPETWPVDGRRALAAYRENRQVLGTLRPPNRVAAWIFRARPDVHELVLVVRHPRIDPATGRIGEETFPYRYHRPGRDRD